MIMWWRGGDSDDDICLQALGSLNLLQSLKIKYISSFITILKTKQPK
jgi:hypothetical protein